MNHISILLIFGALLFVSGGVLIYFLLFPSNKVNVRSLMGSRVGVAEIREKMQSDLTGKEFEKIKEQTRKNLKRKKKVTLPEKFFRAGIFSDRDKRNFELLKKTSPVIGCVVGILAISAFSTGVELMLMSGVMGLLFGAQLPWSILDRRIRARDEEIMFFLPLVIEQVSIGVSSSLDIGPCLHRIVQMADERDTHNAVTELMRHSEFYMRQGVSLEESLTEVGKLSGYTELKHAFMSLAQVAKHGGEVTRQLQELADAVASQRETRIEAKIKKLELEATGPVALVFFGFLIILLSSFGLQVMIAFN